MSKIKQNNLYSIADLERISGVKAHTIRIWEKRYDLFNPTRTKGNHRLYDDEDFMRLLNIARFVKNGYRISKVAKWSDEEVVEQLARIEAQAVEEGETAQYLVDEVLAATISFDEMRFERAILSASGTHNFEEVWMKIFVPVLQRIGHLWLSKKINPAQEHFLSTLIRRKIALAIDNVTVLDRASKHYLLFLPQGEHHELGLMMCQYIVRKLGLRSIYLGQNVPIENIKNYLKTRQPSCLITFAQSSKMSKRFRMFLNTWDENYTVPLVIGGALHRDDAISVKSMSKVISISSIDRLKTYLNE